MAAALLAVAALVFAGAPFAGADQLANARAEARSLNDRIHSLGYREAALSEQYDAEVAVLGGARARVAAAARSLVTAKRAETRTMSLLQQDAVQAYVGGGAQAGLNASVAGGNVNDALLRQELAQTFAADQTDALDSYHMAAADAIVAQAQLVLARNADARQVSRLGQARAQVQAAQARLVGLEGQVTGQIATIVAQLRQQQLVAEQKAAEARLARARAQAEAAARARAAAAAREEAALAAAAARQQAALAAAAARQEAADQAAQRLAAAHLAAQQAAERLSAAQQSSGRVPSLRVAAGVNGNQGGAAATTLPGGSGPVPASTVPASTVPASTVPASTTPLAPTTTAPAVPGVSATASVAVTAALSRVGDPYVWGASGPTVFDCSGLVMWAYGQAGVSLPHFSGAQYADTIHIPMSDLQPGDLVFPYDPGQHVAMYIGNGEVVQAPYTGSDVQVVPLSPFFVLASRVG